MAIALKQFDPNGVAITDETVLCDEAVVIDAVTYYKGYLGYITNGSVYGDTSPDYGLWSAAAKGGTRYSITLDALPASTSEVEIDIRTGTVWSRANMTYYARYLAFAPNYWHQYSLKTPPFVIEWPYVLTASTSITLAAHRFETAQIFSSYELETVGGLPSADATITLSNGTDTRTITLSHTATATVGDLSDILKTTAAQTLTISTADGKGAFGIRLSLRGL